MVCLNCNIEIIKGKFCSKRCSNLYNAKRKSQVFKIVKSKDHILGFEELCELRNIKNSHLQLEKYGYYEQAQAVKDFVLHYKMCPYCKELYYVKSTKSQIGCPKHECNKIYKDNQRAQAKVNYQKFLNSKGVNNGFTNQDRDIARKAFRTKYGVNSPFNLESVRSKSKITKLQKYGDENYNNIEKQKQTIKSKYGVSNISQIAEVQNKAKETKLQKYGDENYNNHIQAEKTNILRYGAKTPLISPEIQRKSKITSITKYGTDNYSKAHIFTTVKY